MRRSAVQILSCSRCHGALRSETTTRIRRPKEETTAITDSCGIIATIAVTRCRRKTRRTCKQRRMFTSDGFAVDPVRQCEKVSIGGGVREHYNVMSPTMQFAGQPNGDTFGTPSLEGPDKQANAVPGVGHEISPLR